MTDKDQFTFDDDDDFPETPLGEQQASPELDVSDDDFPESDLSAAFAEGEHSAEPLEEETPVAKAKVGGSSRTRTLLLVLLLVVIGGAGAFYFMDLGGTTPSVPTATAPEKAVTKTVALPPKPAPEPAAPSQPEQAAKPVTVTVPPPPPPTEAAAPASQASQPDAVTTTPPAQPEQPVKQEAPGQTKPETAKPVASVQEAPPAPQAKAAVMPPEPKPAAQPVAAEVSPAPAPMAETMPAVSKQVANGAYALDAGSYLLESNRDSLVAKIKELGYEPLVTPVDATLDMTRLRLGTFDKSEVQEALAFARSVEPGCYSAPAGDRYVIYAGTFKKTANVDKLSKRFLEQGITVHPEPVQVVRTLSRIRFGSFASKDDATAAAREIGKAGLKVEVVKSK